MARCNVTNRHRVLFDSQSKLPPPHLAWPRWTRQNHAILLPSNATFMRFPFSFHALEISHYQLNFLCQQKFTIPQRLFFHFYLVAFLWTTLLLVATWAYAYRMVPVVAEPFSYSTITSFLTGGSTIRTDSHKLRQGYAAWEAVSLLLLMEFHVLRRLYETIHVFDYSPSARMHVIGYLTGLL
ncbi:hypothetical protein V8G54_022882 [Vigna mungo]|uniref:Polyprenol reductase n=1 Tax=Vigna mungo TaxID=3915 RepID=A0AAQ3N486_VIGMU